MPRVQVNGIAESDGVVFKIAPAGSYTARISKVEMGATGPNSKNPGSAMLKYAVKLQDDEVKGVTIFDQVVMPNPSFMDEEQIRKATARLRRLTDACGLVLDEDGFDTEDLLNAELVVVVGEDQTPSGEPRNTIKDTLVGE